jgi:glycosyltransferase involved in cell wall biosynthesis
LIISSQNVVSAALRARSGWERSLLRSLIRWSYPRADFVTGVAQAVIDDLASEFGVPIARLARVPNPIVTAEMLRRAREPLDHPWFAVDSRPVILGVGRLARQKRFDVLVEAFAILLRRRPARLLILGEGDQRGALEAQTRRLGLDAEQVALPGYADNPYPYLAAADLFVLSSDFEGLPSVLIEALALGCPVISTDCPGGSSEILHGGEVAPLVPADDPSALAGAMERALAAPPDREPLRRRGSEFGVDATVEAYLALLGTVERTPGASAPLEIGR